MALSTGIDSSDGGETDGGDGSGPAAPVWAVFGDLMSGLVGAFVLILVAVIGVQLELATKLEQEVARRQAEEQRRTTLEQALAGPLAASLRASLADGRVTLNNGRIGINGSLLFAFNSDELQPEGRALLKSLAGPLAQVLVARDELLMVSGYTDDRQVSGRNRQFTDNWELSAQRALTVTRALIEAGVPARSVFAAAFGPGQPVASNADPQGRARNRRVELAPTPRPRDAAAAAPASAAAPR